MTKLTISLLNYRFRLELRKTRRKTFLSPLKAHLKAIRSIRSGSKLSRFFRHVLERLDIKAILGGNLALFVMVTGVLTPATASLAQVEPELTTLEIAEQPLTTEITIQYPTNPVVVNQGYHFFHFGVDLDGVTGDPIRPIKKGRVARIEPSRWGYGNNIVVDHGDGMESLYAHLSEFEVEEGQEVDTRTVIGRIGSTGRSTGDHLHLEVYRNGRPVNPVSVLGR